MDSSSSSSSLASAAGRVLAISHTTDSQEVALALQQAARADDISLPYNQIALHGISIDQTTAAALLGPTPR